ncbi:MAG: alpha/beta fold hydrolase [candidate division KSB1 bacterium]|nr:alpha/beta fold hydrolase [candidate division KSB1 bacterium]MDQ7066478.1 alpha/beta fold hydrolase [candidate division KSB1 bacterium]
MVTLLWIFGGLIIFLMLVTYGISQSFKNARFPHQSTPADHGIAFREVRFPAINGRQLYGWWIPARSINPASDKKAPTIILVHGWGRNLERTMPYIQHLYPQSYNLLAFDSRNHGSSDPEKISSMLKFAEDILAAVKFVAQQKEAEPDKIGVVGLSVGGAAAIYAAARDPRIGCVVTVGSFAHPVDVMSYELKKRHIPFYPIGWMVLKYVEYLIQARFDDIAPVNNIGRAKACILLVHGDADTVVPVQQADKLHQAGTPEKVEKWILPGRGHSDCHEVEGYWERLRTFFAKCLNASPS